MAPVSVGYQLQLSRVQRRALALTVGLLFQARHCADFNLPLFVRWLGGDGQVLNVTVFEAAMACSTRKIGGEEEIGVSVEGPNTDPPSDAS